MVPDDLKYAPRGYLSEESKKSFTFSVGVLGAVFFLAQMVFPFIAFLCLMPTFFLGGGFEVRQVSVHRGVSFDSRFWLLTRVDQVRNAAGASYLLTTLGPEAEARPIEFGTLPLEHPWLLPTPGRLWLVGKDRTGWIEQGHLELAPKSSTLGDVSRPFLFHGAPAVIENTPAGALLKTFGPEGWKTVGSLALRQEKTIQSAEDDVVVVARGDRVDLFLRMGQSIYHHTGLPREEDSPESWTLVAASNPGWNAFWIRDTLVCALTGSRTKTGPPSVAVLRQEGGQWTTWFEQKLPAISQAGVFPDGGEGIVILSQGFPGSFRVIEANPKGVKRSRSYGGGFPFGPAMFGIILLMQLGSIVPPLLMAVALSGLMRRHRIGDHSSGESRAPYASLTRRALAQVIDAAIQMAPMGVVYATFIKKMQDFDSPQEFLALFALGALSFAFMAVIFFGFSALEGQWGITPGKWLLGIRVLGTDLKPCGFGRALLRNLLKFADGFFNFMVGLLVSALSENWQRVGDMAARTVVVRNLAGGPRR